VSGERTRRSAIDKMASRAPNNVLSIASFTGE
jgi:hypothetical protein